ncbi:MAG: tetratricopeptide repeat protein [Methylovulum sp.]|uniref:YfgM family protein n=1 Tax=Methylovulum sp. TaxID=1916980 RepID=UPI00260DAE6B|nr:tetratricopeptide repeat protein [Methylovulum sp.]MDD2724645.1 tetratricopeptide repeat protein [Methylovulum sp.]MDD5123472.1 tetratricopeptide repeat protein [Methylovulum sp.]
MEIYETEEEQVAALKAWWKENGQATLIGLGLGIAVILGWNYWQDYQHGQAGQAAGLYAQLLKAQASDQKDSVTKLAEQMETQFKGSDYVLFGELMAAKVKVDQGDLAAARQILEKVAKASNKELGNIAKIRLVRLLMANKEYEQGLKLINDIDPATSASFSGQYDELTGDLYVALDRVDQARTSYQNALRNGQQSPLLQMKLDDLTPPEKIENKK